MGDGTSSQRGVRLTVGQDVVICQIKLKAQTRIDDETPNVREKPLLRSPFIPRHRPMFASYI
jgi:hypothetical protein